MSLGETKKRCGWCGRELGGEGVKPVEQKWMFFDNSNGNKREVAGGLEASFCCDGCAWAFEIESHKIYCMPGKEIRRHLIKEHGLVPAKPAGRMSKECAFYFYQLKEDLRLFFEDGVDPFKVKINN
jgi:hypothetical protein